MFAIDPVKRKTPTTGGGTGVQFIIVIIVIIYNTIITHMGNKILIGDGLVFALS